MAKKGQTNIPWHPNFRDEKTLPDIRVVRSAFFVNFLVITLTAMLLFYWVFLEWQVATINHMLLGAMADMQQRKKHNDELLQESREFERWASLIDEIQNFVGIPVKPSEFLYAIGLAKPAHMTLSQMSYNLEAREASAAPAAGKGQAPSAAKQKKPASKFTVYSILVSGTVNGTSAQATKSIELFRERLEKSATFKGRKIVLPPTLRSFDRDTTLEIYNFSLVMEVAL